MTRKISKSFSVSLALFSIIGFISILLNSFTNININPIIPNLLMIILGFGFLVEGQARFILGMVKNGLTPNEFAKLFTSLFGILTLVLGVVGFLITPGETFNTLQGIIAGFAIIIIVIETWIVK